MWARSGPGGHSGIFRVVIWSSAVDSDHQYGDVVAAAARQLGVEYHGAYPVGVSTGRRGEHALQPVDSRLQVFSAHLDQAVGVQQQSRSTLEQNLAGGAGDLGGRAQQRRGALGQLDHAAIALTHEGGGCPALAQQNRRDPSGPAGSSSP